MLRPKEVAFRKSALHALAPALVALAFAALGTACSSTCNRGQGDTLDFTGGITAGDEYQSSPRGGPYLEFPSGRRYRLVHGLTNPPTPGTIEIRLGFEPSGNLADTAGNQAILDSVDAESIVIENDTCADFFLYVYARGSAIPDS